MIEHRKNKAACQEGKGGITYRRLLIVGEEFEFRGGSGTNYLSTYLLMSEAGIKTRLAHFRPFAG
ncbi:MAG: hypothetical protein ACXU99_02260, partial [Thermodesulfobacteriota bacterium]